MEVRKLPSNFRAKALITSFVWRTAKTVIYRRSRNGIAHFEGDRHSCWKTPSARLESRRGGRRGDLSAVSRVGLRRADVLHAQQRRRGGSVHWLGRRRSSVQEKDRDCSDNAQRDEDEQGDPHADREAVGKRGLTGWDSHEAREPFVEFHSMPSFPIRRTLLRARIC